MRILVNSSSTAGCFVLEHNPSDTIRQLKLNIQKKQKLRAEDQFLSYGCRPLQDQKTINFYEIQHNSFINLNLRVRGGMKKVSYKGSKLKYFGSEYRLIELKSRNMGLDLSEVDIDTLVWKHENPSCIAVSKSLQYFSYVTPEEDKTIQLFDFEKRELIHAFKNVHEEHIVSLIFAAKKPYIISAATGGSVKIFDINTTELVDQFDEIQNDLQSISLSKDENYLVCTSDKKALLHSFQGTYESQVANATITNNNKYIVFASNNMINIFDMETGKVFCKLDSKNSVMSKICFTIKNDTNYLVYTGQKHLNWTGLQFMVFDIEKKENVSEFNLIFHESLGAMTFTNDDKYLIARTHTQKIIIYELEFDLKLFQSREITSSLESPFYFSYLAVTDDSRHVISISNKMAEIHEIESQMYKDDIKLDLNSDITCFAVTMDNQNIVFGSKDSTLKICAIESKSIVYDFGQVHEQELHAVALANNDQYIITASRDVSFKIFDFQKRTLVQQFVFQNFLSRLPESDQHFIPYISQCLKDFISCLIITALERTSMMQIYDISDRFFKYFNARRLIEDIYCPALTNDAKYLLYQKRSTIYEYDFNKQKKVGKCVLFSKNISVSAIKFTTNQKYIIASSSKEIKVIDFERRVPVFIFDCEEDGVGCFDVTKDERFMYIQTVNGMIKVIDLELRKEIFSFANKTNAMGMGKLLVTNNNEYVISVTRRGFKLFTLPFSINPPRITAASSRFPIFSNLYGELDQASRFNFKSEAFCVAYQDFYLVSERLNLWHLTALFSPDSLGQVMSYTDFKTPFWVDKNKRTPLHYLTVHRQIDFGAANQIFEKMIEYLQDENGSTAMARHELYESLSSLLPFILEKLNPTLVTLYLRICFLPAITYHQLDQVWFEFGIGQLPKYGSGVKKIRYSKASSIVPKTYEQIYTKGINQVSFRTVMLCLDYNLKSKDILKNVMALQSIKNEEIFKSQTMLHFVDYLWQQSYLYMILFGLFFSAFMVLISIYVGSGTRMLELEIIILCSTSLFLLFEFTQIWALRYKYFLDVWNLIDLSHLSLLLALLIPKLDESEGDLSSKWITSLMILSGYLRWISFLRLFSPTRNLIQVIVDIVRDMFGFMVILIFIILGFSLIFLTFNRDNEYADHLYGTYKLLYGDSDDSSFDLSQKLVLSTILFLLNVVLLNLLISIMGDSYDRTQERRVLTNAHTRLNMIQEISILIRIFSTKKTAGPGYLMSCQPFLSEDQDEDPSQAEWEGRINAIKNVMKQELKKDSNRIEQEVKKDITRIESKMEDLKLLIQQSLEDFKKTAQEIYKSS